MIRDAMMRVSETLFYLMSGTPLFTTMWFFAWVVFWSVVIVLPVYWAVDNRPAIWARLVFIVIFFPGFMMALGPSLVQMQMMQECKTVQNENTWVNLNGKVIDLGSLNVRLCRYKENFYGEFGEWKIVGEVNDYPKRYL